MREITILRTDNWTPAVMTVEIDGRACAILSPGEKRSIPIDEGSHSLKIVCEDHAGRKYFSELRPIVPSNYSPSYRAKLTPLFAKVELERA